MADLMFLDSRHEIYARNEAAWKREERRLEGGDAVLSELVQFSAEESDDYAARQAWARWLGFGKLHTTILSGHLRRASPIPNYGKLGTVQARSGMAGTLAELFHYNCDGVGNDGQQLPAFLDGVEQRALATGYRWLMAEMPTASTLGAIRIRLNNGRAPDAGGVTDEEVRSGFRPFLVEYSPLAVTNWRFIDGVLVWAVIQIPVERGEDFAAGPSGGLGYYLLVRQGYRGLGQDFARGGWWKYDAQKRLTDESNWADTDGQIPLWVHMGEPGRGTYERPSIGASSTMELGQISADLMNAVSEQRFNLRQAAKSINYWIGIDKISHTSMDEQLGDGSINVAVPLAKAPDGAYVKPELVNSSGFVLDAEAYSGVIQNAIAQAKEIMVRQITSGQDASGVSREAAFGEATSPMLSRIAATAEQSINTGLYFVLRRFGLSHVEASQASIELPRDYQIRNLLADIDAMLDRLATAGVRSRTWESALLLRKGNESHLVADEDRAAIEAELADRGDDKAALERSKLQAEVVKAWLDAGASEAGAALEAGVDAERVRVIFGEPNPTPDIQPGDPTADAATPLSDAAPPPVVDEVAA